MVVGAEKVVSGARAKDMSRITRLSRTVTVTGQRHGSATVAGAPLSFSGNARRPPATLACLSSRGAGKSDTHWLSDNDDRTKPRAFPQGASPSQVTVVESIRHAVSRWRFLPTASRRVQLFDNQPSVLSTTLSFIPPTLAVLYFTFA